MDRQNSEINRLTNLLFALLFILTLLSGVAWTRRSSAQEGSQVNTTLPTPSVYGSRWFPEAEREASSNYRGQQDRRFIYIWQDRQMMYIFEDGQVIRQMPCSTGLPTEHTYTKTWMGRVGKYWGSFTAYGVWADEAWFLFKDDGSILIHGAPYVLEEQDKVYQELDLLGQQPASHGCIRIPPEDARWLTAWRPEGVLTLISPLTAWPIEG